MCNKPEHGKWEFCSETDIPDNTTPDTTDQAVADYRDEQFELDVLATNWTQTGI